MKIEIPSGLGTSSSGTLAATSVEVLESPPSGGLQALISALPEFSDHRTGKNVFYNALFACRGKVKTKGNDT
jgi:hypothetical protein